MFHRFAGFCRRLFSSKGFQRGLRIFFWVFVVYSVYTFIVYVRIMKNVGVPFGEALRYFLEFNPFREGWIPPSATIAIGIALGLIWYTSRKMKKEDETGPDEKKEESSDPAREEEIIEPTHYRYR